MFSPIQHFLNNVQFMLIPIQHFLNNVQFMLSPIKQYWHGTLFNYRTKRTFYSSTTGLLIILQLLQLWPSDIPPCRKHWYSVTTWRFKEISAVCPNYRTRRSNAAAVTAVTIGTLKVRRPDCSYTVQCFVFLVVTPFYQLRWTDITPRRWPLLREIRWQL
jgi:hypothetical protein